MDPAGEASILSDGFDMCLDEWLKLLDERLRKADLLRGVDLYVKLATDLLAEEAA